MKHIDADTVRDRIDILRQWRGSDDPDAKLMNDMLKEIERLKAGDSRRMARPKDA